MAKQTTIEDLRELALHDKIIHTYLRMVDIGEMTLEEALMNAVLVLSKSRKEFYDRVVHLEQTRVHPIYNN